MSRLSADQRSQLQAMLGDRVTFRRTERRLYGHDIAAMPGMIKPLVGDTTPEAVVQPRTEEELAALVRWAAARNVPLTPRGKASSGYGGVLPVKKGVLVDFYRMNRVIGIDAEAQTATVQAGGTFSLTREFVGLQSGTATAQTQDPHGLYSNEAWYVITV